MAKHGLSRCLAVGVSDNRLQNVVITLDKVKLCLSKPGEIRSQLAHKLIGCYIVRLHRSSPKDFNRLEPITTLF